MRLSEAEVRQRLSTARVLRLATVDAQGMPHQVPATFANRGNILVIAVDHKPKRHHNLKRLRNIAENNKVCALVDVYDDDWRNLWWVRADGVARIIDGAARERPLDWLAEKYPQYRDCRPVGPVVEITVTRWSGWAFADT